MELAGAAETSREVDLGAGPSLLDHEAWDMPWFKFTRWFTMSRGKIGQQWLRLRLRLCFAACQDLGTPLCLGLFQPSLR